MAPELHLDPDRLRGHAATAAVLAGDLGAALAAPPGDAEALAVHATAGRAVRELVELSAVLAAVAGAAVRADRAAALALPGR